MLVQGHREGRGFIIYKKAFSATLRETKKRKAFRAESPRRRGKEKKMDRHSQRSLRLAGENVTLFFYISAYLREKKVALL